MGPNELDDILNSLKPLLDNLWEQLPEVNKVLAKRSFDNIVDLAEQYAKAKIQGDEGAMKRTQRSLEHSITALISIVISGIAALEDPVKEAASNLGLRIISVLVTKLFGAVRS